MDKDFDTFVEIVDRRCDRCDKAFVPAPYHIYRDDVKRGRSHRHRIFCSWTCYNHRNDDRKVGKRGAPRKKVAVYTTAIDTAGWILFKYYTNIDEAAADFEVSSETIAKHCRSGKPYKKKYLMLYTK